MISKIDKGDTFVHATAIAGDLKDHGGGYLDTLWQRLKTANSHGDSEKEGLRLTINGGYVVDPETKAKRPQKAVIEFLCDKTLEGDENLWDPEDKYDGTIEKREDASNSTGTGVPSLTYLKYDKSGDKEDTLFLEWHTKYACEDSKKEEDEKKSSNSWGFFTWFIIM